MEGEPTNGELARRIDRLDANNSTHFGKIFERLDGLGDRFVTRREYDALVNRMSRLNYTVVGLVICPIVVGVVLYLLIGGAHP